MNVPSCALPCNRAPDKPRRVSPAEKARDLCWVTATTLLTAAGYYSLSTWVGEQIKKVHLPGDPDFDELLASAQDLLSPPSGYEVCGSEMKLVTTGRRVERLQKALEKFA